jgi:hypothetical protein
MNTKGIRFLAVLAVMVMAFAAVFVLAPAENEDAVVVFGDDTVVVDPIVIDDTVTASKFYVSDDLTVKIKNIVASELTFYVQNGAELELDFKATTTSAIVSKPITIVTVTGDQQRITTSTINATTSTTATTPGKIIITGTEFNFTGADKQNVVYVAMMPKDVTTTYTTSGFETNVTTDGNALISASEVLVGASTGSKVAVAPSQSIESTSKLSSLVYGIAHKDGAVYTYYATGMNAGSLTIDATTDDVTIKDGSAIVNNGTSSIKATSAKGDKSVTFSYVEDGQTKVAGKLKSGSMNVSGKVLFDTDFENKATITLNANADVVSGSEMTVTGSLILKNEYSKACNLKVSGTGFIVAENEKIWYYTGTTPVLKFATGSDFTGQYDVSAINKSADVFDSFSNAKIEKNQTFRMIGDTVIANAFIIEGILYIEPGVTLTITQTNNYGASVTVQGQYAQIVNNGTIVVKTTTPYSSNPIGMHILGGSLLNNGTINVSSASGAAGHPTFTVNYDDDPTGYPGGYGVVNGGAISIGKHDTASLDDKFTNEGTVTVNGAFYGTNFVNGGTFTLSSAKIVDNLNVTMSKGSVFTINSVEVTQGKIITIQNSPNTAGTEYANSISFTAAGTGSSDDMVRITGVTVVDSSNKLQGNKLDLSGSIGTSIPSSIPAANAFNVIATKGHIDVTGTATINKGYKLDLTANTTLDVSGKVNIDKDVKLIDETDASAVTMPVIGVVTDMAKILTKVNYVGAMYTTPSADIYTNLEDAIAAAIEAEVPQINVNSVDTAFYYVTVSDDLVIPEGLTIDGNYLVVDDKATILVQSGGRFSFDKIVIEDGLISAEDVNDIDYDEIVADVKTEDDESTAAACMSLEVALMLATPGSVIELSNTFYAADADLVIPADVTVDATATNGTDFVLVNSNLTVNGMLIVDQFAFVATTDDTIGITVNGFIYDKCSDGACFVKWWYNPFGVSYYFTDDEDHTWYVLTTIENIQPAIDVADDAKVYVEGDAYLDELTVSGRDDMPGEVTFKGNVDIDTIYIDEVTLIFKDGKEVNTTVKNSVGSITITGAYVDKYMSIYDMAIYSSEDVGVYMEGVLTDNVYGTYGVLFEGITGMDGTDVKTATNYGNYDEGTPTIVFAGATTVIGKKVYISDDDEYFIGPTTTVTGGLYVANNAKLTINGDVQVLGSLVAADRTEEGNPGAINANGHVFVGMLESDIYDYSILLGDAAILAGEKISLAAGYFIYVAPTAVIDPAIVEDLDTMTIFVDDEEWFTLYGYENDKFGLTYLAVPMANARVAMVLDEYGGIIDCDIADGTTNVLVQNDSERTLSGYGNVYIVLNYDIFEVKIKTDGSVKAVYIDGILMETGNVANIFTMVNVAAGTHKVTVEAATGYDADKCVLYTELGTILPGMGFTFTEYDCTEYDADPITEELIPVVVYNINGTEIQPEPVPPTPEEESQWTVTTILLVILVVLIAIMAVIVALRLNRS